MLAVVRRAAPSEFPDVPTLAENGIRAGTAARFRLLRA